MHARFRIAALTTFAVGVTLSGVAAGEELPPNAALSYWPGSLFLPRYVQLEEGEQKAFSDPVAAPLDDAAKALVGKSGWALRYVHRGAQIERCDWGTDPTAGPMMLLPHMDYVRPIQRVMLLQARLRIAEDRDASAVETIADSMVMARHLATDGTLVGHMVRCALEAQAIEVIAANLGELDLAAVSELEQRVVRLPKVESAASRIERERDSFIGWARTRLAKEGADGLRGGLSELARDHFGSTDKAKIGELVELLDAAAAKGPKHFADLLSKAEGDYAAHVAVMNASANDLEAAVAQADETVAKGNVVTRILMGSVINPRTLREVELKAEARLAMLRAALAITQHGPSSAAKIQDPFGAGPLEYTPAKGGFTLTSDLTVDGHPFAVTFSRTTE